MPAHTNQQIVQMLKDHAKRLGTQKLSYDEIAPIMPVAQIKYRFGTVANALKAAGLQPYRPGQHVQSARLDDEALFRALYEVEQSLGHEPRMYDCNAFGQYSVAPYLRRFARWSETIQQFRKWKQNSNLTRDAASPDPATTGPDNRRLGAPLKSDPNQDPPADADARKCNPASTSAKPAPTHSARSQETSHPECSALKKPDPKVVPRTPKKSHNIYGEFINFRGLRHAPTNEQGVVFLFGMVSKELGFSIDALRQGFPDCEGKYLYDPKKALWTHARIEFEYRAKSFQDHRHDPTKCDFLVCWINDWPLCPITVIELKTEILKLPPR